MRTFARDDGGHDHGRLDCTKENERPGARAKAEVGEAEGNSIKEQHRGRGPTPMDVNPASLSDHRERQQCNRARAQTHAGETRRINGTGCEGEAAQHGIRRKGDKSKERVNNRPHACRTWGSGAPGTTLRSARRRKSKSNRVGGIPKFRHLGGSRSTGTTPTERHGAASCLRPFLCPLASFTAS